MASLQINGVSLQSPAYLMLNHIFALLITFISMSHKNSGPGIVV